MLRPKPLPSPDRAFLQALLIRLGYWKGARVNRKHLEDERYTDPKEGKRKPVFEDPDNDFKWSSGRPLPSRVQNAVAIWLKDKGYLPFDGMWSPDHGAIDHRLDKVLLPRRPTRTVFHAGASERFKTAALHASGLIGKINHVGAQAYDQTIVQQHMEPDIAGLEQIVSASTEVREVFPAIRDLALQDEVRGCFGCGRAARLLQRLRPLFEMVTEPDRIAEILRHGDLKDREAIAQIHANLMTESRLQGEFEAAKLEASKVEHYVWDELAPFSSERQLIDIGLQSKELLGSDEKFRNLLDRAANAHGTDSHEYLGLLQCRACQAVFKHPGACTTQNVEDLLEEAKQAQRSAIEMMENKSSQRYADAVKRGFHLEFLSLCYLEEKSAGNSYILKSELARRFPKGDSRLQELRDRVNTPVRRAKIDYWLWVQSNFSNFQHLYDAKDNINKRGFATEVCVANLKEFGAKVDGLLADHEASLGSRLGAINGETDTPKSNSPT